MCRIFVQTYIETISTSQIKVDIAKSYFCIFFFYLEKEKLAWCYITLETIRHYKVITLFFSIPINIYLYFIGKLVQQIAALAFGIVILDSFLLLYCRIDWELTRHFVWVIEELMVLSYSIWFVHIYGIASWKNDGIGDAVIYWQYKSHPQITIFFNIYCF